MSVPILRPNPCVKGWIILAIWNVYCKWFSMDMREFNARENPNGWMFKMSPWDNHHMGQFLIDVAEQAKMTYLSQDMWWHHDVWVVLLENEMMMKFDVVVSLTIEHAHVGGVCGQTSLDSAQVMFGLRRRTSPQIWRSHIAGQKMWIGLEFSFKACCERVKITISHDWKSTIVTPSTMFIGCLPTPTCVVFEGWE